MDFVLNSFTHERRYKINDCGQLNTSSNFDVLDILSSHVETVVLMSRVEKK